MTSLLSLQFLHSITLFVTASTIPNILLNPTFSPASISHPTLSNLALTLAHNLTTTTTTTTTTPLSFLETIMSTVVQTTATHPTATFRLVRIASRIGPTTSLAPLSSIRIIFSIVNQSPYKTLTVDMCPLWSVWKPPTFSTADVPSDMGNMRLDVETELVEAWDIMWNQGVREVYDGVLLYWPMLPPKPKDQQPYYRFQVAKPATEDVYVGAWSQDVERSLGGWGIGNESAAGLALRV